MNRLHAVLAVGLVVAGCTGASNSEEPSALAPSPTLSSTSTPAPPTVSWPDGVVPYPVGSGVSPLPYLEYLPPGYGDGTPRPLLVYLHGVDEEADGSEASLQAILPLGVPQLIADGEWPSARPFVVLMPQEPAAKSGRCNFGPEIGDFLAFAVDRYKIDAARIYLTGISCGAIGVWDYLAGSDDLVAATVPIAGHPVWAMDEAGCEVARRPTWVFHGSLDDIVPIDFLEEAIGELGACTDPPPVELELTTYPDADHDAWTRTYDLSAGHDIYAWLLEHRND
jgi:predicted esterase